MPSPSRSIRAHALSFAFPSSTPIFDDVSFHCSPGFTGLVGGNGAGKTTLLRLIRGDLKPTSGHLLVEPRGASVLLCQQRVDTRDEHVDSFVWAADGLARRLQGRLKLTPEQLDRWPSLSPGERKRWQLGAALWSEPDVLLLDEPSNHLDEEGLALLKAALTEFHGVGLIVSHDRTLLDDVTKATLRLAEGTAALFPMPFSNARAMWTAQAEAVRDAQRETKRRLQNEERKVDERRRALESASRQRSAGVRMRNKYDSEARSLGADFRAEMAERAHAKTLRRVERQASTVRDALADIDVNDEAGGAIFLHAARSPKPTVIQFRGDVRTPDGSVVLHDVNVQLGRDEHLWIQGPNGRGKTTLLNLLLASCDVPEERRLVLPQELSRDEIRDDVAHLKSLPADEKGRVLQLVHALGVEPDQLLRTAVPSPGEGRKLRLALGLGRDAWLAVLDEPTNHLDLPSIERLEAALTQFSGALLLVTHDAELGRRVTSRRLVL